MKGRNLRGRFGLPSDSVWVPYAPVVVVVVVSFSLFLWNSIDLVQKMMGSGFASCMIMTHRFVKDGGGKEG